jgi:hypothetical protein
LARQDGQRWRRTAKPCGPDAPTLASSWRKRFRRRRWQTSPVTGESTEETVKTIARGMPGDPGVTVVTNARAFYHTTRGCGRTRRPAFPAPSLERAEGFQQNSGESRREIADAFSDVIACDKRAAFAQGSEATKRFIDRHSGMVRKHQTRNLEIPGSMLRIAPE